MLKYKVKQIDGKLILTSSDIQVGDTFYDSKGYEYEFNYEDFAEWYLENEPGAYKVIGEVSPEAVWIKEGDEFEEDQWKVVSIITEKEVRNFTTPLPSIHEIRIKCPTCKTFH